MKNTTLCYITQGDQVLMLHRVIRLIQKGAVV